MAQLVGAERPFSQGAAGSIGRSGAIAERHEQGEAMQPPAMHVTERCTQQVVVEQLVGIGLLRRDGKPPSRTFARSIE
jgi:hypothetical protein